MSSLLPLSLNPPLSSHIRRRSSTTSLPLSLSTNFNSRVRATSSGSDREEIRWLREEQRWLREEQRWLREEQRWIRERESLLREISELKLQIKALENRNLDEGVSVSDTISNIAGLLQVLKEKNLIAERATLVEEEKIEEEAELKEVIRVLDVEGQQGKVLREGSEGEEVKAMQGGTDVAAVASVTEISEMQQRVIKDDVAEVEVSQHRVFLLGENRWEEPSRLVGRDQRVVDSKTKNATTKCLTCHGVGRLMCSDCDGTGEPNIEPQFMEWVDEGTKCPYCEGLGHIICDVCEGKTVV